MIAFEPNPLRPLDEGMAMARDWLQSRKIPDQYAVVETVMSNIDRTALAALIAKYALRQEFTGAWKYLDLPYWLARAARNAAVLGLERRSPCNVLDLGSGGGQTLAICNALGHSSVGLEMPSAANDRTKTGLDYPFPIYDDLEILLGTHREFQLILPGVRLKSFNRKFDVVTAYLAFFHNVYFDNTLEISQPGQERFFNLNEWQFFLNDLVQHHLSFPAVIHLELNGHIRSESGKMMHDSALLEWFTSQGATIGRGGFRGAITFDLPEPRRFM